MRVIQDSDDEFDDSLEADVSPTRQLNAPEQHFANDNPQQGTGSTESLKRAIEPAHRAHLQSQTSQNEPQSSISLPEHPRKRRKVLSGDGPQESPEAVILERKTLATAALSNQAVLSMESTMREHYTHHNHMALFPEPSSTVPNATLTQQRVLETVTAPIMLGDSAADNPHHRFPSEPSVPLSDVLFPPSNTSEQLDSTNQENTNVHITTEVALETPEDGCEQSISQKGLSTHLPANHLRRKSRYDNVDPDDSMTPHGEAKPSQCSEITPTTPSKSHRNNQERIKDSPHPRKDQAIISSSDDDLAAVGLPKEEYKPRPSRSRSLKIDGREPIDYSVKPEKANKMSKRRKTTAASGSTHATTTPEKIQQICDMGFTPSSTERALKQNHGDITQTVDWLVRNGIGEDELASHNTPKKLPASKGSHNAPSIDHGTIQGIMHGLNEYRKHDSGSLQDALFKESIVQNDTESLATNEPSDAVQNVSPKVQVVIATKSPRTSNTQAPSSSETSKRKPKRRKTTSDQPEPEGEPLSKKLDMPEVKVEPRRGRGRPKKIVNPVRPIDTNSEVPEVKTQVGKHAEVEPMDSNLFSPSTTCTELEPHSQTNGLQTHRLQRHQNEAPIAKSPPKRNPATIASKTPERSTKPGSHSPNDKGKVSYRVGLSKRARIAPLLRTLKK